jgi:hypothetical protein
MNGGAFKLGQFRQFLIEKIYTFQKCILFFSIFIDLVKIKTWMRTVSKSIISKETKIGERKIQLPTGCHAGQR